MLDDLLMRFYTGDNRRPRRPASCMQKGGASFSRQKTCLLALACLLMAACQPVEAPTAPTADLITVQPAASTPTATSTPAPQPSATFTAEPAPPVAASNLETIELDVPEPWPLTASIYLPAAYAADPDARFPVLYLLHGLLYTNEQWVDLGILNAADNLFATGESAPYIIVMPWEHYGTDLEALLMEHLIPYIDAHYRTESDGTQRAIGGLSRGGGWAVRIGLHYAEDFVSIGLHSPANFTSAPYFDYWLRGVSAEDIPRIAMDIGERDSLRTSMDDLAASLDMLAIPYSATILPGDHEAAYWSANLTDYLRWYGTPWSVSSSSVAP